MIDYKEEQIAGENKRFSVTLFYIAGNKENGSMREMSSIFAETPAMALVKALDKYGEEQCGLPLDSWNIYHMKMCDI